MNVQTKVTIFGTVLLLTIGMTIPNGLLDEQPKATTHLLCLAHSSHLLDSDHD